jgi:uncharacterized surface protein with fasciclin (FAS1) repeats
MFGRVITSVRSTRRKGKSSLKHECCLKWSLAAIAVLVSGTTSRSMGKDIVDTAVGAGSFNPLAAALKTADLVSALRGDGPFTVVAPTDEAFSKHPKRHC